MKKLYSVAIDGPSGAGKSSVAKAVAKELSILYVDTGAIYRTIGLSICRRELDPKSKADVLPILPQLDIRMAYGNDGLQHMLLNGEDVTVEIRKPEISLYASDVSAMAEVRDFLMEMQRDMARKNCVIMDGRDIGTIVLPDADVKIFLTASAQERARRRYLELQKKGMDKPYEEILAEQEQRDYNDTHRAVAPLKPAQDSMIVDTTELDFEQSKEKILSLIREKLAL